RGPWPRGAAPLPRRGLGLAMLPKVFPRGPRSAAGTATPASYSPVVIVLLLLGLISLYHVAPPRRLPWRRGVPGALLAMLVFLAGSAGLRSYITFLLEHNHAYGTLAAPIAALLYFYLLGLGILLGAELNAAIELLSPTPVRPPRALDPRNWQRLDAFEDHSDEPPSGGSNS